MLDYLSGRAHPNWRVWTGVLDLRWVLWDNQPVLGQPVSLHVVKRKLSTVFHPQTDSQSTPKSFFGFSLNLLHNLKWHDLKNPPIFLLQGPVFITGVLAVGKRKSLLIMVVIVKPGMFLLHTTQNSSQDLPNHQHVAQTEAKITKSMV